MRKAQSGQVMIIIAVWLVALIGSAALILLTGSVEWQRNQLQQLADQSALDAALVKIGVGCDLASATKVIQEADAFLATQRSAGVLSAPAGSCAAGYTATDNFSGGLAATYRYPYRGHQQQVEVSLTLSLPISFGNYLGASTTTVTRRAVAQQLKGSTAALTATTLTCTGGQFNVGGSVVASSAITLSGGCAIYAHDRFDAASSTYSDLGNASVYTNGQAWVGGGGHCAAGANTGSSIAVCADGYELSGHTSTTCGTSGTSAFLSAGDAAINANPCAVGTAPQPMSPLSTTLPPEPNADPAITVTLPGGVACASGTTYPNIAVNGVTVGNGNAAAPTQPGDGYVHFKKGCYGYLDVGNLGTLPGSITNRQIGAEDVQVDNKVDPTLPLPSTAGTLLVVTIHAADGITTITGPGGSWTLAASAQQAGEGWNQIWYLAGANNPGGISTADWKAVPGSLDVSAQMTEWNGALAAAPLDQTGSLSIGVPIGVAAVTSGLTTQANELVLTSDGYNTPAGQAFTGDAAYSPLVNDLANGYASEYRLNAGIGVQTEAVTAVKPTQWSLTMATFKPAPGGVAPTGAVLDPGFYYFNGNGFAGGGGGICLNSNTLLARDVTLELVNQAGFSTGSCAVGGGASCAGAKCQFGSTPCSISACPPNAPADSGSGGGYTWFAAPCPAPPQTVPGAPAADTVSCLGASSWCPPGDRACWNLLIWTPTGSSGQIAIKGGAAHHWLLGSIYWAGTCTDTVNGTSTIDGTVTCATFSVSAAAGAGIAVGSDYGVNTAVVEAVLVE